MAMSPPQRLPEVAHPKPTLQLPASYNPKEEEKKIQAFWDKEKIYQFDQKRQEPWYSIDTPPPTVSGRMHIGHAFSYTQGDFIARYHRMKGENVFYPFGTDDNGLPTERLIEKMKNVRASMMDRQEFIKLCLTTLGDIKPGFVQDWKNLGISCDFTTTYSTIDPHCVATSQRSFIDLYEKGRIYQEEAPMSWCTQCQTAIAQAEFDNVELTSTFNDILFSAGGKELLIATTRPELLPACVAVFANPSDKRYSKLIGKFAKVPLFNHEVPIIADGKVDPEKGTGIVMCCTFGDMTDIQWWKQYKLPLQIVFEKNGKMNSKAGKYQGLSLKDARKAILDELKEKSLLVRQQQITHAVNVHERCSTELEFLKTRQWFIKVLDKKQELIEAGGKIAWHPAFMKTRYTHWVENLNWDWCISRQRFFGVPFPIWYEEKTGKAVLADKKQLPVDPMRDKPLGYTGDVKKLIPETDVMDTWATSSMTPQIALDLLADEKEPREKETKRKGKKGKEKENEFARRFPMSVRFQAHDIIRTWAFDTIVKAAYHHDTVPWSHIMVSGHALDPHGKKMSKSKGNVIDPGKVLEKFSADALRFWAAGSKLGDDLPYQEKDVVTGQKMATKLWNASKFCIMHLQSYRGEKPPLEAMDQWLLSRLHRVIKASTEAFDNYEYSKTKSETEQFFWHDFCDNYLEITKGRLYSPDKQGEKAKQAAQFVLYQTNLAVLKLIAPIMPHIAEAIYQLYFAKKEKTTSIHLTEWPAVEEDLISEPAEAAGNLAITIIAAVRKFKSDHDMALNKPISEIVIECSDKEKKLLAGTLNDLQSAATAAKIGFGKAGKEGVECDGGIKINVEV
ncbi:valine--tRNA ligase [Candidatus Woesearchaeota archaeon]|nr:valine--tRNA ligase [Candidatus Woesearchaeota archaeon]